MSRPFEHGGNIIAAAREQGFSVQDFLDYSANINPLGPPTGVGDAVREAMDFIIHYPDAECAALKAAISQRYGVPVESITVGNGAAELLYVLCHMRRPHRVLVTAPSFSEYERASRAAGAEVKYLYLDAGQRFKLDMQELASGLAEVDIVFICNPNNPTGQLVSRQELEYLIAAAARHNALVVVDESFSDFLPDQNTYTCRPLLNKYPNLIILHSLTKFYAIPGLRLGFALSSSEIGGLLSRGKDPWNVNTLAQVAGTAALKDEAYRTRSIETMSTARAEFFSALAGLPGFNPLQGVANYLLINIAGSGYTSDQLRQAMFEHRILIRDCGNYPGLSRDYIRVAVKLPHQNATIVKTFAKLLKGSDRI